jgi:DNA-binding XRE family transcriptional regulator
MRSSEDSRTSCEIDTQIFIKNANRGELMQTLWQIARERIRNWTGSQKELAKSLGVTPRTVRSWQLAIKSGKDFRFRCHGDNRD